MNNDGMMSSMQTMRQPNWHVGFRFLFLIAAIAIALPGLSVVAQSQTRAGPETCNGDVIIDRLAVFVAPYKVQPVRSWQIPANVMQKLQRPARPAQGIVWRCQTSPAVLKVFECNGKTVRIDRSRGRNQVSFACLR